MHDQGQGLSSPNSQEDGVLRALGIETKRKAQDARTAGLRGKNRTDNFLGWVGTFERMAEPCGSHCLLCHCDPLDFSRASVKCVV